MTRRPGRIGGVMDEVLALLGIPAVSALVRIGKRWGGVVGPYLASRTRPATLRRGVLTVTVASHALAQELQLLKPTLLARLSSVEGGEAVRDLRFAVGPVAPAEGPGGPSAEPARAPEREVPDPEGLGRIGDPETRGILRSIARRAAARKP